MPTIARPSRSRRARSKTWVLRYDSHDEYSVLRNGRQLRTELSPLAAQRYIAEHRAPGEKVLAEDPDGTRADITRKF